MEKMSWTLHLEGREQRYRQHCHEEWKRTDFYFLLFTFGVYATLILGPTNVLADPTAAFAIGTLALFTLQMTALLCTPDWYLRYRAVITVASRLVRICLTALMMTEHLMMALTNNPRWQEFIPGWELKALSLSFGVFFGWLPAFGCPLPFTLALPLQLLHVSWHASLWFKHGVSALARSKLLPYLLKLTRHTADLVITIMYVFDPFMVAPHRASNNNYSSDCMVLPLAVTIVTMLCCITPMYIVYCTEALQKLSYIKQQHQGSPAASSPGQTSAAGSAPGCPPGICISPAVQFIAATGVKHLALRIAWGVVLLFGVASLVQLSSSYVVEMLLVPHFGIADNVDWCPEPVALAAAAPLCSWQ